MTLVAKPKVKTFGEFAVIAIKKHFDKATKWQKSVKEDIDPEALHQMRVGMRRLRTAVTRFGSAVNLPNSVSDRTIGKIARRLGNLRDLDVLKETLNTYQPKLPPKEQKTIKTAFDTLTQQRQVALADVRSMFKGKRYQSFIKDSKQWLSQPSYYEIAQMPIREVLPDLLLPEVSCFLLHRGWLVGTLVEDTITIPTNLTTDTVGKILAENEETLHSLRKQGKRLRYQMELFTDLYSESYADYVTQVKSIQGVLGELQDSAILTEWLNEVYESKFHKQLPTFANLITEHRTNLWSEWQPWQLKYLKTETRHELHLAIMHPM